MTSSHPSSYPSFLQEDASIHTDVVAGASVHSAVRDGLHLANLRKCLVVFGFNGHIVRCCPGMTMGAVYETLPEHLRGVR